MLELTSISKSFADVQVLDNLFLSVARQPHGHRRAVRLGKNNAAAYSRRV
jgi:ABC-type sugar transport system ATPase subunit